MSWSLIGSKLLLIPVFIYLSWFLMRLSWRLSGKKRKWLPVGAAFLFTVPAWNLYSLWAVILLYFTVSAVIVDSVSWILKRLGRDAGSLWHTMTVCGVIPLFFTTVMLGYGYWNIHHVVKKEYTVHTDKEIREEGYCVVFLSDLHFGFTMEEQQLLEYCRSMEENEPDVVILGGDIVDENTTYAQMQDVFRILSGIESAYGVFYVYGNHDTGRYGSDCEFTAEELRYVIESNGICILEDETYGLNSELTVTGRIDRTEAKRAGVERKDSDALLDCAQCAFHIIADHQPRGFMKNSEAGYDLMLSGHTHAGQIWPAGIFNIIFDRKSINYGYEQIGDMGIIVSSGMAGWGYPIRTGNHCEYVVVHILAEEW